MEKNILFLLDNTFENDRRVYREAKTLVDNGYRVHLLCVKGQGLPDTETKEGIHITRMFGDDVFDIKRRGCFAQYVQRILAEYDFRVIHAHDHTMLHLASLLKQAKQQTVLVYDSHELFHQWPLNISNYNRFSIFLKSLLVRKWQIRRERKNRRYIDHIITVNDSLAQILKEYMGVANVLTLRNVPEKGAEVVPSQLLREKFNIPADSSILVFIGANIYAKTLNLEQVIDEFANLPQIALVFICADNQNRKPIEEYVRTKGAGNVFFHGLVPPAEIATYLASASVGLVPTWNKKDLSYWYALDNKLFEYINAGLPVLATAQPEYKTIVEGYGCGVCVNPDMPNAYRDGMTAILNRYDEFRNRSLAAAQELCWETEQQKLVAFYQTFLPKV